MRSTAKIAGLITLLLLAAACAKEPAEETQRVDSAVAAARTDAVREYAPDALDQAEKAASAFHEELAAQKEKYFWSRSYDKAKSLADDAVTAAQDASTTAEANKQKMKDEVTKLAEDAKKAVESAFNDLGTAPVGKGNKADIEAMKGELQAAQKSLDEMDSEISAEKYKEAKVRADSAIATAQRIQQAVEQARQTVKRAGRKA